MEPKYSVQKMQQREKEQRAALGREDSGARDGR